MEKQHPNAFNYDSYSLPSAATHIRLIELLPSSSVATSESADHPLTKGYHELVDLARPQFERLLQATVDWNDRLWFRRVWTVQELCLCQDTVFVCGYRVA